MYLHTSQMQLFLSLVVGWLCVVPALAIVSVPGVEFNAAAAQIAHASSYYHYAPNPVRDTVFTPQNAIDGFTDESSWWSSGDENPRTGKVYWQLNMTEAPPTLKRIVIRWHGFLTPAAYKVRVSYLGENFQTIAAVANLTISYDRVDTLSTGLEKVDTRFMFLRVVIDTPNVCADTTSCALDGSTGAVGKTNERVVYGIREFELWSIRTKNAADRPLGGSGGGAVWRAAVVMLVGMWIMMGARGG